MRTRPTGSGWMVALACLGLLGGPLTAAPRPQLIDDFIVGTPDGRPLGWETVALGATAQLTHVADARGGLRVNYTFDNPDGVIFLVRNARLRAKPYEFELSANGAGGQQLLGVQVRDAVDGEVFEYRAEQPLREQGFVIRTIAADQPELSHGTGDNQPTTLEDGGGLSLEALTLRLAGGAPLAGSVEITDLLARVDVRPEQRAMVEVVTSRPNGVCVGDELPQAQLLVTTVSDREATIAVDYQVVGVNGQTVGRGEQTVEVAASLARVPVELGAVGATGHWTIRAHVEDGNSERHATGRVVRVPAVPQVGALHQGRPLGAQVRWHAGEPNRWIDAYLLTTLRRLGGGLARVEVSWDDLERDRGRRDWTQVEHWAEASRVSGVKLVMALVDQPRWARRGGPPTPEVLAELVGQAAEHAGDAVFAWELWQEPNTRRYWPPEPRPYAYRTALLAAAEQARAGGRQPLIVNGGLRGFDAGFAGTLMLGERSPIDALALSVHRPRYAVPHVQSTLPSEQLLTALTQASAWLTESGRAAVPPWIVNAGLRTSPVEASLDGQAEELARCAVLTAAFGGRLFWHTMLDGQDSTDRFGLFRGDLGPKPAALAFAVSAAQLHGAADRPTAGTAPTQGLLAWPLDTTDGLLGVVLAEDGAKALRLPAGVQAVDRYGQPLTGTSLQVGHGPVYLRGQGVAEALGRR